MSQLDELAELKSLLELCCSRVEMFVGERSVCKLGNYVCGYLAGRDYGNSLQLGNYLRIFELWLATREKTPRELGWVDTVLTKFNQDEDLALAQTPLLFAEFAAECGEYTKKDWYNRFGEMLPAWRGNRWSVREFAPSRESPAMPDGESAESEHER